MTRVYILCPAATTTGGPEALHQLAGALRSRGVDAAMVYYGQAPNQVPLAPPQYRHYDVAVSTAIEDAPDTLIIVPEVVTSLAWRFPRSRKAIWWLSVDNFFKWRHLNPGPSVFELRPDLMHLCQSFYAYDFLGRQGAGPRLMLTDYLATEAFQPAQAAGRLPLIAYNPKKAPEITQRLIDQDGRRAWIRLEGLDRPAFADLLQEVRLYVDFGPHPGRDRIPREAALCGAVVITGRRGAASSDQDVRLPDRFRLDEQAADFEAQALTLIDTLLRSEDAFCAASAEQSAYRTWIGGHRTMFMAEVDGLIAAAALLPEPADQAA